MNCISRTTEATFGCRAHLKLHLKFVFEQLVHVPALAEPFRALSIRFQPKPVRSGILVGFHILRRIWWSIIINILFALSLYWWWELTLIRAWYSSLRRVSHASLSLGPALVRSSGMLLRVFLVHSSTILLLGWDGIYTSKRCDSTGKAKQSLALLRLIGCATFIWLISICSALLRSNATLGQSSKCVLWIVEPIQFSVDFEMFFKFPELNKEWSFLIGFIIIWK